MALHDAEEYVADLLTQVRAAPPTVRIWLRGTLEELLKTLDEIHLARAQRSYDLRHELGIEEGPR